MSFSSIGPLCGTDLERAAVNEVRGPIWRDASVFSIEWQTAIASVEAMAVKAAELAQAVIGSGKVTKVKNLARLAGRHRLKPVPFMS